MISYMAGQFFAIACFIWLLAWLAVRSGIIDKKYILVRKGVWRFALYSLLGLALCLILASTGVLDIFEVLDRL